MPATFIPDMQKGPGNGIIIIKPMTCEAAPSFAIYRSSDRLCLSPEGWQGAEVYLAPTAWNCHDDALLLAVDENIVNYLDKLSTYKIVTRIGDKREAFTLSIEDIIQTSIAGGQGVGTVIEPEPTQAVAEDTTPEEAPVHPTRHMETPSEEHPAEAPKEAPLTKMPPPIQSMEKIAMPAPQNTQHNASGKKGASLLMVLLVLALIAGVFWWFMQQGKAPSPTENTQTKEATDNTVNGQTKKPETAQQEQPTATQSSSAVESARALLRKNDTGAASMNLANTLKEAAKADPIAQDAVFLLIEDAAQKGELNAMRELAIFYDPSITSAKGSITPDIEQAHMWYTKAIAGGDAQAKDLLATLRTWVEKAANDGDRTAQHLLERW